MAMTTSKSWVWALEYWRPAAEMLAEWLARKQYPLIIFCPGQASHRMANMITEQCKV